jgi:hypothetical protein
VISIEFQELLNKKREGTIWRTPGSLLVIDPGETSGYAVFKHGQLINSGSIDAPGVEGQAMKVLGLVCLYKPTQVLVEDYKIYASKLAQHTWSSLNTPQLIGAIKHICEQNKTPITFQMASTAKQFCTDDKLKQWGFWKRGDKHARDAIRHGCYYLLFSR